MISKGDDFPIHQLPTPVAEVGTERNFYDRYFLMDITMMQVFSLVLLSVFIQT